jgi:hypothetical protein
MTLRFFVSHHNSIILAAPAAKVPLKARQIQQMVILQHSVLL